MRKKKEHNNIEKYAEFDDEINRTYRYLLRRKWDESLPQVTFVMLNPSDADENKDDPTLDKCIKFAQNENKYGSLEVVNLFAYIATKPGKLKKADDPVGQKNDLCILSATKRADLIILAWGAWLGNVSARKYPSIKNRAEAVLNLISGQKTLHCLKLTEKEYPLGLTKQKFPRHPLYLRDSTKPIIFPFNIER